MQLRTSPLAAQLEERDRERMAAEAANEKETTPKTEEAEGPRGPRIELHRSWRERLFGYIPTEGCACTKSFRRGWLQRQIETPRRIPRFFSWLSKLPWRGCELGRVLVAGRVSHEQYEERRAICFECDGCVMEARQSTLGVMVKAYCLECQCPRWLLARLAHKLWFAAMECPRGKHPRITDRYGWFKEFKKRQEDEWAAAHQGQGLALTIVGEGATASERTESA